jgi:hypothetical protein
MKARSKNSPRDSGIPGAGTKRRRYRSSASRQGIFLVSCLQPPDTKIIVSATTYFLAILVDMPSIQNIIMKLSRTGTKVGGRTLHSPAKLAVLQVAPRHKVGVERNNLPVGVHLAQTHVRLPPPDPGHRTESHQWQPHERERRAKTE